MNSTIPHIAAACRRRGRRSEPCPPEPSGRAGEAGNIGLSDEADSGRGVSGRPEESPATPESGTEGHPAIPKRGSASFPDAKGETCPQKATLSAATAEPTPVRGGAVSWGMPDSPGGHSSTRGGESAAMKEEEEEEEEEEEGDEEGEETRCGPLSRKSRLTPSTSASSTNLSRSGADCPVSHLVTDWRDTPVSCASSSWERPIAFRRACIFPPILRCFLVIGRL